MSCSVFKKKEVMIFVEHLFRAQSVARCESLHYFPVTLNNNLSLLKLMINVIFLNGTKIINHFSPCVLSVVTDKQRSENDNDMM